MERINRGRQAGFSLVELPPELSADTLARLADTRISGVLIDLQLDKGPAPRRSGPPHREGGSFREGSRPPGKKPRHKHD